MIIRPSREAVRVAVVVASFACGYTLTGVFRHWQFGSSAFDLGIFDQVIWHLSRFEAPASSIRGVSNIFGDHFHPIILAFAPLYWIAPAPETLIVAQSLLLAASIVPVFLYLRSRLPFGQALGLCVAYGLFWGMQQAAVFDVHEVAFAPVFIATAILAADRRRWSLFWASAIAVALVKEELILWLAFLGAYLFVGGERKRGALLCCSSLLAFSVVVGFVIPAFSDASAYGYRGAFAAVLQDPWRIPMTLVTPPVKIKTALMLMLPFALLPLRSRLSVLVLPFVVLRFLSSSPNHWGTIFHYSAPLAPILAMSAGDGLAAISNPRAGAGRTRVRTAWALTGCCIVLAAVLPGNLPVWDLFEAKHYRTTQVHRTGYDVIAQIPGHASVVAQAAVVPHISQREHVHMLTAEAPDADYVVASSKLGPWPFSTNAEVAAQVSDRLQRGYVVIVDADSWVLLRRSCPRASLTQATTRLPNRVAQSERRQTLTVDAYRRTPNVSTVFERSVSPGERIVDGNAG